jgi:glycosyltransferase involved in cell wall biosynthesis
MSKVYFVLDKLTYGGGEILLIQICKELIQNKFDIEILVFDNDVNQKAYSEIKELGINIKIEGKNKYNKLLSLYKNKEPFIIHSYALKSNFFTRIIFAFNNKAFLISHHHGNGDYLPRLPVIMNRYSYFLSDINISVSNGTMQSMYKKFKNHKSMKVIYNFSNIEVLEKSKNLPKTKKIKLISINRLVPSKNIYEQINIVKILKEKGINVSLDILGDGPLYTQILEYINQNHLSEYISLQGEISNKEIISYIDSSDIMLFTSKAEGLGIVPIEAMSRGLPVCAYNIDGLNEVVEDSYNGKLATVGDITQMAENIISIFDDSYSEYSKNAIQTVKNKFNGRKILDEYLTLYNRKS